MQHHLVAARRQRLPWQALPLLAVIAASWTALLTLSVLGDGAIVRHDRLLQDGPPLWVATLLFLGGWQVMLGAMMVAPALPAIRHFRLPGSQVRFLAGYVGLWTLFGLFAFVFDVGVHTAVKHSPWLTLHPWVIAGVLLVAAGTYQLSRVKVSSLAACRDLIHGWQGERGTKGNALRAGLAYGVRCLGADWGLMLLVFALAASSLVAMAAATLLMLWEAGDRHLVRATRIAGYALIAVGVATLPGPVLEPLWIG